MAAKPPALENGGWTPALRSLALELMDELLRRPAAAAICDPTQVGATFRGIRDRVAKGKYATVSEWNEDFVSVVNTAKSNNKGADFRLICEEVSTWFDKRYQILEKFSQFHFKDVALDIVAEMQDARNTFAS